MARVLLLLEDYNELVYTETFLKKVGFDVLGQSNESTLNETLLSFRPEIIIALGRGIRISAASVGRKLQELSKMNFRIVLLFPSEKPPQLHEISSIRLDALLEIPIDPLRLLEVLAKLSNQKVEPLIDKFHRLRHSLPPRPPARGAAEPVKPSLKAVGDAAKPSEKDPNNSEKIVVRDGQNESSPNVQESNVAEKTAASAVLVPSIEEDHARMEKYAQWLQNVTVSKESKIDKHEARKRIRALQSSFDMKMNEDIDVLKREFARDLFVRK